jgi:DNA repair exonuclease SbcCD ATPase subunit
MTIASMVTNPNRKQDKESLEQQLAAGTTVVQGKSNEEMERLLQQGFKQREQMKQENDELAEQLSVVSVNAANVVKAVQAKDMMYKMRHGEVEQLKKRLAGDKSEFAFEHQAELDALRKFKETNPELRKALYDNKTLQKQVKELKSDAVREQMVGAMEELKSYNNGLTKQCVEFGKQKEAMESNMVAVEEMIEEHIADLARLRAENQGLQAENTSLQGSKTELESMIEETMNLLEASQNEHNTCKADLERASAESSGWEAKSTALEAKLEQTAAELEASRQQSAQLEQDLAAGKTELETMTATMNQNVADHKKEVEQLTDDWESTKDELAVAIQRHEATAATLNSQVKELEGSIATEQEAVKAKQTEVETLEASQQELLTEKASLEQQIATQKANIDAANASLETEQGKLAERDAEVATLTAAKAELEPANPNDRMARPR